MKAFDKYIKVVFVVNGMSYLSCTRACPTTAPPLIIIRHAVLSKHDPGEKVKYIGFPDGLQNILLGKLPALHLLGVAVPSEGQLQDEELAGLGKYNRCLG